MGQGLGKNSPVLLTLGKDNYEALIDRHGQFVRWRVAEKCSCVKPITMQPDIHCKICGGRGYNYTFQKTMVTYQTVMLNDEEGFLKISDAECDGRQLLEVYDMNGNKYLSAEKLGSFIYLNVEKVPQKGTYFTVVTRESLINHLDSAVAEKNNQSTYYTVPGLENSKSNIDGVYYSVPSDIISIGKIIDGAGIEYVAKEFRLNKFLIEPTKNEETQEEIPITEPITVENVEYLKPFTFVVLSQNFSKTDAKAVEEVNGDAICSFPYGCDVANDDILTVLTGTYTNKEVISRTKIDTDTLGVYFVYDVVSCKGIVDGEEIEYIEGKDFVLVDTNKIKWLATSENAPMFGESYSITYHVLPTYRATKQIPQLRTSEDQRFPKKVVLKLFNAYAEKTNINVQKNNSITRKGIDGSF